MNGVHDMPTARRINRGKTVNREQALHENALKSLVNEVGDAQKEIDRLTAFIKESMPKIETHLKGAALTEYQAANGALAHWVTPASRDTSTISVAGFKKLVHDKDFMASISVTRKAASELLGARELAKITTTIPASPKKPELKVEFPK